MQDPGHDYTAGSRIGDAASWMSIGILINGNHFFVEQDRLGFIGHGAHVVACQQRRRQERPEAHVSAILVGRHAAVTDFQHVRIIPVAGLGIGRDIKLLEANLIHRLPTIADVASGAPEISADLRAPVPDIAASILAEAVNNRTACTE